MPKNTFKGGQKKRKQRKAKTKDGRQDQRLKKLENILLPSIEYKSVDQVNVDWQVSSSGRTNYPMFQLSQGTDYDQRIGDKITLLSHNISTTIRKSDSTNSIRVMWIVTPSTTPLSINQVLEYGTYNNNHEDLVFSSPYKRRAVGSENTYTVLFDKVYHFGNDEQVKTDKYQLIPAKNGKQLSFTGVGATMPDNYQLQLMAISDSGAVPDVRMDICCRSRYYDL